ncbi:MAG TPA: YdcF family protein [Candidatus Acidoferrales bacterium]|nr:YdcF family protein [Candidatus Acidoferrales bacterium]
MSRRFSLRIVALAVVLALGAAAAIAFRGAGRWLVREDPLGKTDVIVVLSGSMPARAIEAGRIYQIGEAPEVWLSRPESPHTTLGEMGIPYIGEEEYNREVLIHEGVPETDVHILQGTIVDTEQEIEEVAGELRREGKTSATIVTSPQHTRRVKTLWRKLAGKNLRAIVRGAPQDDFDADHWWSNTRDAYSVAREMMGLLNAWAGLPVRPHSS